MPDDATGDLCPTCGGEFELEYHGQLEVDRCTSCRSIWFDRTELAAYARRKAAGVVTWGKRVEHLGEAPGPYSCPRCKEDTLTPYKSRTALLGLRRDPRHKEAAGEASWGHRRVGG